MLLRKVVQSGLHLYLLVTTSLLILEKNDNRIVSITLFDIFLDTHYVLSLDLIRRRSTCEVAAGTACDTTPSHEVIVPPATRNIAVPSSPPACQRSRTRVDFAGMRAKKTFNYKLRRLGNLCSSKMALMNFP